MSGWPEIAALSATAQHIDLVQQKLDRLTAVRHDSWLQMLAAAGRLYLAHEMTPEDLLLLLDKMRGYGPGFGKLWDQVMPVKANKLRAVVAARERERQESIHSTWFGSLPFQVPTSPALTPPHGVPVVYVLFDSLNEPVYVGSTAAFWSRMKGHHILERYVITHWMAYRCNDREHAYQEEERLLATHKPRLNVRSTR